MRFTVPLASAALLLAAVSPLGAQKITHKEDALLAAGFMSRPADTPERADMLARLPDKKFVRRMNGGGQTTYVYADVKNCNCLYVGSERAYGAYRREQQRENIASEQEFAAMDYRDAAWNWGAWGPYTGGWGRFGFRGGLGW